MNLRLSNIPQGGTGSLGNYRGLMIHVANPFCGLRRICAPRAGEHVLVAFFSNWLPRRQRRLHQIFGA